MVINYFRIIRGVKTVKFAMKPSIMCAALHTRIMTLMI